MKALTHQVTMFVVYSTMNVVIALRTESTVVLWIALIATGFMLGILTADIFDSTTKKKGNDNDSERA